MNEKRKIVFNLLTIKSVFIAFFFCLICFTFSVSAQISLPKLFSENAVLQRQKTIPVWGWAKASEDIQVSLGSHKLTAKADINGKWMVKFPPMEAGGPYTLKVSSVSAKVSVGNILIGEVWLCSGQSNMEWTVKQSKDFEKEKEDADYPKIRHFFVDHVVSMTPKDDLDNGVWKESSPETVGDFTAIGFFFAREIYKELGVPIGLVHSSWGGSQIEGWISREAMLSSEELRDYGQNLPKDWVGADAMLERNIKEKILGDANANPTLEDEKKYTNGGFDFSKWHRASAMWQWDWQGIWAWRGNGFMAKTVELPAGFAKQETVLGLAEGYQYLEIHINGNQIFSGVLKGKRQIIVPKNTWKSGENRIVVKMNKMIEPEWFGLGMMGSAEEIFVASEDGKIQIGGSDWYLMPSFAEEHTYAHSSNNVGTAIYNGMIAPLVPYGIRGVLWYQGETNAGRSYQYRRTFPLMIQDWRNKWNQEFPFYFVQLSSYGANQSSNAGSGWAELREAQTMALSLPKTGMAVTIDIGNKDDVHPLNKQDVGHRLAANALKLNYGRDILHSSPLYDSVKFENGRAIVTFVYAGQGMTVKDKFGYVRGFEIAGADKVFYYSKAEISGDKVIVENPNVKNPVAVRYAWSDAPVDANLFNSAGFPASPFRTDKWDGITVNEKFK